MLNSVGINVKTMVRLGSKDKAAIDKLSGKVLGYGWQPSEDLLSVGFRYNVSRKRKGKRLSPDLSLKDIPDFKAKSHNRRSLL